MGLETGTFIDDLVVTNPPGSDDKRQGDDHLRLIKSVLKNTVKRGSKAFYLPGSVSKSANYTVSEADENLTIQCDTTAAFTLTLPILDITRAGWSINVVKATTDMNPVFLQPTSELINGYAKVRRSVPASITQVMWTGSLWVASRSAGAPVGSVLDYYGTSLPQGHLWADGAAINSTNYVEATSVLGANTPDLRGRVGVGRDDMGGTAALRITNTGTGNSGINGATLKATGGTQTHTLSTAQIPSHTHALGGNTNDQTAHHSHSATTGPLGGNDGDHTHGYQEWAPDGVGTYPKTGASGANAGATTSGSGAHSHTINVLTTSGSTTNHAHGLPTSTGNNSGGDGAHLNMQPMIVCNAIVVAE